MAVASISRVRPVISVDTASFIVLGDYISHSHFPRETCPSLTDDADNARLCRVFSHLFADSVSVSRAKLRLMLVSSGMLPITPGAKWDNGEDGLLRISLASSSFRADKKMMDRRRDDGATTRKFKTRPGKLSALHARRLDRAPPPKRPLSIST